MEQEGGRKQPEEHRSLGRPHSRTRASYAHITPARGCPDGEAAPARASTTAPCPEPGALHPSPPLPGSTLAHTRPARTHPHTTRVQGTNPQPCSAEEPPGSRVQAPLMGTGPKHPHHSHPARVPMTLSHTHTHPQVGKSQRAPPHSHPVCPCCHDAITHTRYHKRTKITRTITVSHAHTQDHTHYYTSKGTHALSHAHKITHTGTITHTRAHAYTHTITQNHTHYHINSLSHTL